MLYSFLVSSIKFQGHMGWKINDFNPIWVRLLDRSQLSNSSDLPCLLSLYQRTHKWIIERGSTRGNCLADGVRSRKTPASEVDIDPWPSTLSWSEWCTHRQRYLRILTRPWVNLQLSGAARRTLQHTSDRVDTVAAISHQQHGPNQQGFGSETARVRGTSLTVVASDKWGGWSS